MIIRSARPADAQAVLPLVKIVFDEMELASLQQISTADLFKLLTAAFTTATYRYSYQHTLVAEEDGKVVGIAVSYPAEAEAHIDDALATLLPLVGLPVNTRFFNDREAWPHEWYLDTLAVLPGYQNRGIGTRLLAAVNQLASQHNYHLVSLNVDQQNPNAQRLYERVGYHKVGELPIGTHYYNHMQQQL